MARQAPELAVLLDEDYRVLHLSQSQEGTPDVTGQSILELGLSGTDSNLRLERAGDEARRTGLPQHFEATAPGSNWGPTHYSVWLTPLDSNAGMGAFCMTAADVTHTRRVEDALAQERGLLESVVAHAPDAIFVVDQARCINFINRVQFGWRKEHILDQPAEAIVHVDDRPRLNAAIDRVFATGNATTIRSRVDTPEGVRWFVMRVGPVERAGAVERVSMVATDVTEQAEKEAALLQSDERFRVLFNHAPEALAIFDVKACRFIEANPQACALFGRTREQMLATNPIELSLATQPDGRASVEVIQAHARRVLDGALLDFEWVFSDPEGKEMPCEVRLVRMPDRERQLIRASYVDVRQRKREEAERAQMSRQLAQAQKLQSLGQLTGGIAHDFNNLLLVILSHLEFIEMDGYAPDATQDHIDNARRAGQRAAELTARLLAFARRQPLRPNNVNANRLIVGIESLLHRTLPEQISLETVLGGGLWLCEVDPAQLENTVLNLALNARDAMPQGGRLTIETANAHLDRDCAPSDEEVTPGQYVMLAVTDSGGGIAPDDLPRIFEPFFTTKGTGHGTGLGLSMVYGFVKQSGGHVKVHSEVGVGTTVRIYLPRASGDEAPSDIPEDEEEPRGDGQLVLVVEDDDAVRKSTETMLARVGYSTISAPDAPTGLELVAKAQPLVLLTDVVLAGPMNGAELARQARAEHPELKVVFMSGYTEDAVVHNGRLDPGIGLLEKPFSRRSLAFAIRDALRGEWDVR